MGGSEFFNEMLNNYSYSLPRKRIRFPSKEDWIKKIRKNVWKGRGNRKFIITKEKLEEVVWEKPLSKIDKLYDVSDIIVINYCKRWKIKKSPRGYWV